MQVTGHFRRQHALPFTIKTPPFLAVFKKKVKDIVIYKSIQGID